MKQIIACFLMIGICIMLLGQKETVPFESECTQTVSWLRDQESAMGNAEVKVGSFFVADRNTVYGADCTGCMIKDGISSTSAQIEVKIDSVRQSTGQWKKGITYDGYYLIAADKALPMCTVVRISGHSYFGEGISKGEPFLALVVDRGSMIREKTIDLFAGSEMNALVQHDEMSGALIEIVGFLTYKKGANGKMVCVGE